MPSPLSAAIETGRQPGEGQAEAVAVRVAGVDRTTVLSGAPTVPSTVVGASEEITGARLVGGFGGFGGLVGAVTTRPKARCADFWPSVTVRVTSHGVRRSRPVRCP